MDFSTYSDDELDDLQRELQHEIAQRQDRIMIPLQMKQIAQRWENAGKSRADLARMLTEPTE